jgi:methylenetetrahydrofolate dehydrogenase (NADP+)/methenyltetrahydrofolate cyclohydrolase
VRNKHEKSREAGMVSFNHTLPGDTPQDEVADLIQQLNDDDSVHGILLQLPAPDQIDDDAMTALIDPMKDVDGLTPVSVGRLVQGKPGLVPATPAGCMELLRAYDTPLEGAEAVVVGRSQLVGKPVATLLLAANATVTHCHSRTRDLAAHTLRADILVAAVGVPEMITGDMVKEGATVIDVGVNRTDDGLKGDVHFESVEPKARAITPVPGGVGQMTIAMLLQNTLTAARMQVGVASRT